MFNRAHWLHIYEKPAVADAGSDQFYTRIPLQQYRHSVAAMGWYDTASAILPVDKFQGEQVFNNYVGNRVAVYAGNPTVPIWEGLISRVTLSAGSVELSRTLEGMANRVAILYTSGSGSIAFTSETTDADSIATYGSIQQIIDLGELYAGSSAYGDAVRVRKVADLAYPLVSVFPLPQSAYGVYIEMIGFYHTLTWDAFEVSTSTNATNYMTRLLTDTSPSYTNNAGIFYDDTDTSDVATGSFAANTQRRVGETTWDLAQRYAEGGISGDRAIVGINPTDINTGLRNAYFRVANEDVEYTIDAYGDGRIRDVRGALVAPYAVRPDRSIRINNIDLGAAQTGYITRVEYDADSQDITWYTDEQATMAAVLNTRTIVRSNDNAVQKPRTVYS